jgi:glycosyltransferase involved in cell wall biosynthesis
VAVSEAQRLSLIEHLGVAPEHIMTITNGVRRVTPLDGADIAAARAELGFRPDHLVIGCIAVLGEQKGIAYLLDSAKQICESLPHARFLIIGGGPLEQPLREKAVSLGLADRVVFTGWKQSAARLLPIFDMFVMSSLWEAMPLALLEAMAARRQIVVTDVGDNRAIVDNGRCAVVIAPGDATAITDAVLRIAANPREAAAMADRARKRFDERFTTHHMVGAHEQLYERIVQRRRVPPVAAEHVRSLDAHADEARVK